MWAFKLMILWELCWFMTLGLIKIWGVWKNVEKSEKIPKIPKIRKVRKMEKNAQKRHFSLAAGNPVLIFCILSWETQNPPETPGFCLFPPTDPFFGHFLGFFGVFRDPPPGALQNRLVVKNSKFYQKIVKKSKKMLKNAKKTPKNLGTGCIVDTFLPFFSKNTLISSYFRPF